MVTSSPKITEETSSTSVGTATTTEPISALDKATFPFPCYLEMVSIRIMFCAITNHFIQETTNSFSLIILMHYLSKY